MSTPESPRPGGSHRAAPPPPPASAGSPLLLPLLSALVVLGAIGLAAWMLMTSGDDGELTDNSPTVTQPTADTPTPDATNTGNGDGDGNGGDGDGNGGDKNGGNGGDKNGGNGGDKNGGNGGGDKNGGDGKGGDGDGGDGDNGVQAVPQVPVYVFNQTSITGLAAQTGAELDTAGWNVVGVDNWIGTVPEDTVYFYPGDRAAADRLSHDFPGIGRVWPASAPMPAGALTVILADTDRK